MPIMKLLVIVVVLALVIGGTLQYMGYIKLSNNVPQFSTSNMGPTLDDYDTADAAFLLNKYSDALDDYKKALANAPNSDKAPSAMYRIGKCDEALNKNDDAIDAFKAFVDKYPNDSEARKATERIEYLKSAGNK